MLPSGAQNADDHSPLLFLFLPLPRHSLRTMPRRLRLCTWFVSSFSASAKCADSTSSTRIVLPSARPRTSARLPTTRSLTLTRPQCKSVARDWRLFARVNTISPGFFDTAMGAAPEVADTVHRYSVLGRQGDPKELAGAFLVRQSQHNSPLRSPQSSPLTWSLHHTVPRLGREHVHHRPRHARRRWLHPFLDVPQRWPGIEEKRGLYRSLEGTGETGTRRRDRLPKGIVERGESDRRGAVARTQSKARQSDRTLRCTSTV